MKDFKLVKKQKRFNRVFTEGTAGFESMEIWVDTLTGVNYLYRQCGYSGGIVVMVDETGKPIVTDEDGNIIDRKAKEPFGFSEVDKSE